MAAAKKCRLAKCRRRESMAGVLPHEMVWEILTWLPTKSLMRFKAASKLWLSTILDPNFARAHRSPFRGLLAMNPDPHPVQESSLPTRDFFFANFDDAINVVDFSFQFSIPSNLRRFQTSNIMNGIICFYNRNVAKLCNIATREIINLPKSRCVYPFCNYHLLIDPIQSVYKVLKISHNYEFRKEGNMRILGIECEILTLGVDLSWRSIQSPPNGIMSPSICADGVLHLMTLVPSLCQKRHRPPYIFNVAGEKFQSVNYHCTENLLLPAFGIIPVMARCIRTFNPEQILIAVADYRDGSWTNFNKYTVDKGSDKEASLQVRGSLPNGNLLIISKQGVGIGSKIYLFDKTKTYLEKYSLRFPASTYQKKKEELFCFRHKLGGGIFWHEDNIMSLKTLTGF